MAQILKSKLVVKVVEYANKLKNFTGKKVCLINSTYEFLTSDDI